MNKREDVPQSKKLRRCKGCGQYAVYRGKWGEECVWRCRYCGLVVPLTDQELDRRKANKD